MSSDGIYEVKSDDIRSDATSELETDSDLSDTSEGLGDSSEENEDGGSVNRERKFDAPLCDDCETASG